jgi:uncharacterized protein with von Willebrand factor type A (vWA) domain
MQKILETLSKQAIKDKTPNFNELEDILRHEINTKKEEQQNTNSELQNSIQEDGRYSLTKLLKDKGYLKEEKNWLTNKGFFEVGRKILQDIMYELNQSELGFHETHYVGGGNVIIDTTKKFETGSDIKFLSVPHTVLNAVQRQSKISKNIQFPLVLEPDDLEEFETLDDVRVAIVYCIDLSSTMKYSIGKSGKSRIEAAKRALWSLYVLNKKFFPNDSISIVGFASMASVIDPFDIPFLKTFDTNDNFLHYTNYQAAFRLARKILQKSNTQNKRIVMITDGQPSACFIENEHQKTDIISEKPYSNFYVPDKSIISRVRAERNLKLDQNQGSLVYLCYRYKKVDPKINLRTLLEGKKCLHHGIQIDTIVVSEETELVNYVQEFEKELKGRTYHINQENMDTVLVHDYLFKIKKIIHNKQHW